MPTVNVASRLNMNVLVTGPSEPGHDPTESWVCVGTRDPNSVNGWGITYNVDSAAFAAWQEAWPELADDIRTATQAEIDALSDSANTHGFQIGLGTPETPATPPGLMATPYIELTGSNGQIRTYQCSNGGWTNAPTSYTFQWHINGTNAGTNSNTYTSIPSDMGKTINCTVTATNATGSTTAPPSNSIII